MAATARRRTEPKPEATPQVLGAEANVAHARAELIRSNPRYALLEARFPGEFEALAQWTSTFYPFQREWLLEPADFAICNKSRQIGTSHTTGGVGVLWGAFHGEMTTIISKGERESIEVLEKCAKHANVLQQLGSKCAETLKSNTNEIVFASGGRILALPASGGRSFTGNVFLDEFAYQAHASDVWDNAAPVALLGYKIRVVSTPNGVGNDFYDLWDLATNEERRAALPEAARKLAWVPHIIPIEKAISQGYPVDLARCWDTAKGDPRLFEQMFNCSFLDNVMQYISQGLIDECLTGEVLRPRAGLEYYAGLDIGREVDLSVLVVVGRDPRTKACDVVHVEVMKRTDSDGLEAMVDRAFERYQLRRLCIDATGLGAFPAERIKKKHSERIDVAHRRPRVEPLDFTPTNKELFATGLYAAMTGQLVRLPTSDEQLPTFKSAPNDPRVPNMVNEPGTAKEMQREIASIRRVISPSGNVQYTTPRTAKGHGDRAWALMLALHARSATNPMIDALISRTAG